MYSAAVLFLCNPLCVGGLPRAAMCVCSFQCTCGACDECRAVLRRVLLRVRGLVTPCASLCVLVSLRALLTCPVPAQLESVRGSPGETPASLFRSGREVEFTVLKDNKDRLCAGHVIILPRGTIPKQAPATVRWTATLLVGRCVFFLADLCVCIPAQGSKW